jgi:DNA-binding MarR family transcriptional regulator
MAALQLLLDLVVVRRRLVARVDEVLSIHHGLALGDLALLLELAGAPNQTLRRAEIARRLGITPSGVARQLAPLERIGLVGREPARDARLALVTLTAAGARVVADARATAEEAAGAALDGAWSARDQGRLEDVLALARSSPA